MINLNYDLNAAGEGPKYQRLYKLIRVDIVNGILPEKTRLPSRRGLADALNVSVSTVDAAYQKLIDEGYVYSRERAGYFVSRVDKTCEVDDQVPELHLCSDPPDEEYEKHGDGFQYSDLRKIMREVITEYGSRLMGRPPHKGCAELRNAIAEYLLRRRGMVAQPDQIIIGSGSEYMYGMLVQLLGRERVYGLENPSYEKIHKIYSAQGARYRLLDMDDEGISSAALASTDADVLHVTPFFSYPSGISASESRRAEYIAWAEEHDGIIIEDDFCSEFSMRRSPLRTLYSRDKSGRVIYLNTFSRSLAPSMRMGYMVLPEELMEQYNDKLGFYYCSVPMFDQYVLAKFISRGLFERHLDRVRKRMRRDQKSVDK